MSDGQGAPGGAVTAGEGAAGVEQAAAGGAAGLLANAAPAAGAGDVGAGTEGAEPGSAAWFDALSDATPGQGTLSDKAWAQNKGYKSVEDLVKATRGLETQLLAGDKIVMPKDGDPPEVVERWRKAIGVPDSADGYEMVAPEGMELNGDIATAAREAAHAAGVPAKSLKPIVDAVLAAQLQQMQQFEAQRLQQREADTNALRAEWGANFDTRVGDANRAMKALNLDVEKIGKIEDALGTAETMKLLQGIGAGIGEDVLIGGAGAAGKFRVSPAEAKARLDAMVKDETLRAKVAAGDQALLAEREQMMRIVARAQEAA